jgi:hypothetical protein
MYLDTSTGLFFEFRDFLNKTTQRMLTSLQLKNFKGWKDTKPIRIAPLCRYLKRRTASGLSGKNR